MAMLGAKVVVNYFEGRTDGENIINDIKNNGGEAIAVYADIRNKNDVKNLIDRTLETYGTIDILINCSVKDFINRELTELEWDDFINELDVSLRGLHYACTAVRPVLQEKKSGKIINISSLFVDNPIKGQNKYITVKSAVQGYTRSLAVELFNDNIQVNMVVPNMTETDLLAGLPDNYIEKLVSESKLGRNLMPYEIAQTISFLASDWSNNITGQRIIINAGELPFL